MRFPDSLLDQIRDNVRISVVVGEHVVWDKKKSKPQAGDYWACCPFHGEKRPSFHADDRKQIYHCFGCGVTGDAYRFLTEKVGLSFPDAVERLAGMAGISLPDRGRRQETDAERQEREERLRLDNEKNAAQRAVKEAEFAQKQQERVDTAVEVWERCKSLKDSHGDAYLQARGLPPVSEWPWDPHDTIRFSPSLYYELDRSTGSFPAIVARVQDAWGATIAVWRIYLDRKEPKKAPVENAKVGLGPAAGGAVRIGGIGKKVGIGEGLETCLAAWALENYRFPIWAGLSTSGVVAFEPPMEVEQVPIYPDGDMGKLTDAGSILDPPGMTAARKLRDRLVSAGVVAPIQNMCVVGDALDLLITLRKYEAER